MLVCPHKVKRDELIEEVHIVNTWKQAGVAPKPAPRTNSQPWRACKVIQREDKNCSSTSSIPLLEVNSMLGGLSENGTCSHLSHQGSQSNIIAMKIGWQWHAWYRLMKAWTCFWWSLLWAATEPVFLFMPDLHSFFVPAQWAAMRPRCFLSHFFVGFFAQCCPDIFFPHMKTGSQPQSFTSVIQLHYVNIFVHPPICPTQWQAFKVCPRAEFQCLSFGKVSIADAAY